MRLDLGKFDSRIGENDVPVQEKAGSETLAVLTYNRWILGANAKLYFSDLAGHPAFTTVLDIGFLLNDLFIEGLSAAGTVQNIGPGVKYSGTTEFMPLNIKLAAAYKLDFTGYVFTFSGNLDFPPGGRFQSGLGVEFEYRLGKTVGLRARIGYKINQDLGFFAGLTFGAGVRYDRFFLDYAYVNFNVLESVNKITLSVLF